MELVGVVVRLQVQPTSLKVGERPMRRYDPSGLESVPRLTVDSGGVTGWRHDGSQAPNVHHREHPASKNRGDNGASVGFTGHYAAMRERFGTHLRDGLAGENVLIATGIAGGRRFMDGVLGNRVTIETTDGPVRLVSWRPAEPCVEFARYALGRDDAEADGEAVREALRFLRAGTRGYYGTWSDGRGSIEVGDLVYLD